jgi:hypothetical protein
MRYSFIPIIRQTYPVHIFQTYFLKIRFYSILLFMLMSFKWPLFLGLFFKSLLNDHFLACLQYMRVRPIFRVHNNSKCMKLLFTQSISASYHIPLLGPNILLSTGLKSLINLCEVWGSHWGDYEEYNIFGSDVFIEGRLKFGHIDCLNFHIEPESGGSTYLRSTANFLAEKCSHITGKQNSSFSAYVVPLNYEYYNFLSHLSVPRIIRHCTGSAVKTRHLITQEYGVYKDISNITLATK